MSLRKKQLFFLFVVVILTYIGYTYFWKEEYTYTQDIHTLSYNTITHPNPYKNRTDSNKHYYTEYDQPYKQQHYAPRLVEKFHYESISGQPEIATLPTGLYSISTINKGVPLNPNAFTPVQCNSILFHPKYTTTENNKWELKQVTRGIYIIKKPNNSECLYASIGNTLKSFLLEEGCQRKNVCGLEDLTEDKQLDADSKRTYFEMWKYNNGYALKSVETNQYICLKEGQLSFSSNITPDCLFSIK
jgi:hypothetical protein